MSAAEQCPSPSAPLLSAPSLPRQQHHVAELKSRTGTENKPPRAREALPGTAGSLWVQVPSRSVQHRQTKGEAITVGFSYFIVLQHQIFKLFSFQPERFSSHRRAAPAQAVKALFPACPNNWFCEKRKTASWEERGESSNTRPQRSGCVRSGSARQQKQKKQKRQQQSDSQPRRSLPAPLPRLLPHAGMLQSFPGARCCWAGSGVEGISWFLNDVNLELLLLGIC